jgi:hypothetical protein
MPPPELMQGGGMPQGGPQMGGMPPMAPPMSGPPGPGAPPSGLPPMAGISSQGGGGNPEEATKGIVTMVTTLDQMLSMLANVFAESGTEEISQMRQLLQQATGKFLASHGGSAPSISPTESGGPSFPGGF